MEDEEVEGKRRRERRDWPREKKFFLEREERKREEKDAFSYEIRDSSLLIGVFLPIKLLMEH